MEQMIISALEQRIAHCISGLVVIANSSDINVTEYGYANASQHFSLPAFSSMLKVISALKSGERFVDMHFSQPEAIQVLKALANYNTDAVEEKAKLIDIVSEKLIVSFCEPNNDEFC